MRREQVMESLYRRGRTLQEIGDDFDLTRERIRQILKARGLTWLDGGNHKKAERRINDKKIKCYEKYGCSREQWRLIPSKARRAWSYQKRNSRDRGIGFELKLWDWWIIWQKSGKWEQRGRLGHQYVMCRKADTGPYNAQNAFIALARENSSQKRGWRQYPSIDTSHAI